MALEQKYLDVYTRQEGYLEVLMYIPDPSIKISSVSSNDILQYSNINAIKDIKQYTSTTIATLEENLWLLNGRFRNIVDGTTTPGYISDSMSDDEGEFETNPKIQVSLANSSNIEYFSIMLNPAVPSAYPKKITVDVYDAYNTLIESFEKELVTTEEIEDEYGETITKTTVLETLPSVIFEMNIEGAARLEIEFEGTQFRHRRIRVSSILFGKVIYLDQDEIVSADFMDKTSYACDTLPSRTFKFNVNNYSHVYDVDNPENGYIELDNQTIVQFRTGYNTFGYMKDDRGNLILNEDGTPKVDNPGKLSYIEWGEWKELRLANVYANDDESATFECWSVLDIMDKTYTEEYYNGYTRTVGEIVDALLSYEGFDLSTVEWSSDNIKKPTYNGNVLLPYDQWQDTLYRDYRIGTVLPSATCREIIQLLAFSVGATILIKDNGKIKFACLDINKPETFTKHFTWSYKDFESVPAAEQLNSVYELTDISMPKYSSYLDNSEGVKEIATMDVTAINSEISYSDCAPTGVKMSKDDKSGASIQYSQLFTRNGLVRMGGLVSGKPAKITVVGYPIITNIVQERDVTSNTLVLQTKLMYEDVSLYDTDGSVKETEQIKRKYFNWYNKKFKYKITTRGEPLVNAGDYGIIQTQFTDELPVYILQNHWTFDGTWAGDMEVISLG